MPSAAKIGGNLSTPEVLGRFNIPRLKGFGSISAYMRGVSTKLTHTLTWDCGHGIHLSAQEKWFCKAHRLKKLGWSPRLGRLATRALIVSYVMVESILYVVALIILGGVRQECPRE